MPSVVTSQVSQPLLLIFHTCLGEGKPGGAGARRQGISIVAKPNWLLCWKLIYSVWKQDCFSQAELSYGGGGDQLQPVCALSLSTGLETAC